VIGWYYHATQLLAHILATMFEMLMPDVYKKYRKAFDAGVWERADPGPQVRRVIVYKL
jgi:hypothetical protein